MTPPASCLQPGITARPDLFGIAGAGRALPRVYKYALSNSPTIS